MRVRDTQGLVLLVPRTKGRRFFFGIDPFVAWDEKTAAKRSLEWPDPRTNAERISSEKQFAAGGTPNNSSTICEFNNVALLLQA